MLSHHFKMYLVNFGISLLTRFNSSTFHTRFVLFTAQCMVALTSTGEYTNSLPSPGLIRKNSLWCKVMIRIKHYHCTYDIYSTAYYLEWSYSQDHPQLARSKNALGRHPGTYWVTSKSIQTCYHHVIVKSHTLQRLDFAQRTDAITECVHGHC